MSDFTPTPFVPRRWLSNGHLQTIFGNFLPRHLSRQPQLPPATAELIEVSPATPNQISSPMPSYVLCHCHWQPAELRANALTAILLHGLEGSSSSQYILGNADKMFRAGLNVVRMNMRNCGGTESLTPTLYHSGLSSDIDAVMHVLAQKFSLTRIALVGYSMGGNLVLKLAGELGAEARTHPRAPFNAEPHPAMSGTTPSLLRAVVGVSPALDLGASADALHLPSNRIYERRFRAALLKRFRRKAVLFPRVYSPARADGVRSLRDFDERITAFYTGFASADDYYFRAAAARVLATIAVPTLILHALDDPFVRILPESRALVAANPHITLIETAHGGHCAFLATPDPATHYDGYWAEATLIEFLRAKAKPVAL